MCFDQIAHHYANYLPVLLDGKFTISWFAGLGGVSMPRRIRGEQANRHSRAPLQQVTTNRVSSKKRIGKQYYIITKKTRSSSTLHQLTKKNVVRLWTPHKNPQQKCIKCHTNSFQPLQQPESWGIKIGFPCW